MIKVEGMTKRYARTVAVDDISFEVQKGQIVGFLGPNGAGKTTTMRVLTCFMPPTAGTASVAGFDVLKQPIEVKRRIGYLPETPPLYPDMEVTEYLTFVARIKGLAGAELTRRVNEATERCNIGDARRKHVHKLSKGYRQRVGLAQAVLHNPDVLILDEPTAGLDPKQILETRSLIRGLAGDHTIVLSTHILPEVEQTCEQVIIISHGKLVATDSVHNLTHRLRGGETVRVQVEAREGPLTHEAVQQRIEQVAGVSRVLFRETRNGTHLFDIESLQGQVVRADVARAIVEAGWNLNELRAVSVSLEQIFLELTAADAAAARSGGVQ
ncbi:MAG TPA: ATP-binding cassette domain-containing protein [Bryobacteraceae bacterium]|nr:ATP-binding cassette domain-containing protein [Bryobacteraceae bacterium]